MTQLGSATHKQRERCGNVERQRRSDALPLVLSDRNGSPFAQVGPERVPEVRPIRRTILLSIAALGALPMAGLPFGQGSDNAIVFRQDGRAGYYGAEFGGKATASGK